MSYSADFVMCLRTAQRLRTYFFACYSFNNLRSGNEHLAGLFHHKDKVGNGRRIDGTAGARPHNYGNLRDNTACYRVAVEDFPKSVQSFDAFLDTRSA